MRPDARIVLWDLPVRLFHWSLAALVVFSYVTGKIAGPWLDWHMRSGYAILALLGFRIAWGFVGSDSARFAKFVRGPRTAWRYARDLGSARSAFVPGHNPLGGWMVLVLLAVIAVQAATGLFVDDEIATRGPLADTVSDATVSRMSGIHDWNEWLVLGAALLHSAAIAVYQWVLGVDLMRPMWTGLKTIPEGISPEVPRIASNLRAAVVFALSAAAVFVLVVVYPRAG